MAKVYLNVAFKEKDDAKSLGAQFDWEKKQWYILDNDDISLFQRWLPDEQQVAIEGKVGESELAQKSHYSIRQLKSEIQSTIRKKFPTAIWIVGEIIKITPKHGHLYLELQDDEALNTINKRFTLRVNLWKQEVNTIQGKLEVTTGQKLSVSQRIRIKVKIEFNTQYDLSGVVIDIDPELTLGQIALAHKHIREKLIKEGVFLQNKNLPRPVDFCRVVVIHPDNASGFHDFKHLGDQLAHVCEFIYIPSRFEGEAVERDMQHAFDKARTLHQDSAIDALVMIRGGGSRQGLLALITEPIIRAIVTFPAPVVVGVGHTDDKLLIDEAANISCGTPSKVIEHIVNTILAQAKIAEQHFNQIQVQANQRLTVLIAKLSECYTTLKEKMRSATHISANTLTTQLATIKNHAISQLNRLHETLISHVTTLNRESQRNRLTIGRNLTQSATAINTIASIQLHNVQKTTSTYHANLLKAADYHVSEYQNTIMYLATIIKEGAFKQRVRIEEKITNSFETIELLNPTQTLKRGYCLSLGKSGVIKSLEAAKKETIFTLRFIDGEGQVELTKEKSA